MKKMLNQLKKSPDGVASPKIHAEKGNWEEGRFERSVSRKVRKGNSQRPQKHLNAFATLMQFPLRTLREMYLKRSICTRMTADLC